MYLLASGQSFQSLLQVPCFDALLTILNNYDGGIVHPYLPSQMGQDLNPVGTPSTGDIVLVGSSVQTKTQKHAQLVLNNGTYGVVVDSSTNQVALVGSGIRIVQAPGPVSVGQVIDGMTVEVVGSLF